MKLIGDTVAQDWIDHFDVPHDSYVKPIRDAYERLREIQDNPNRNDVLRPLVRELMRNGGKDTDPLEIQGVYDYYQDDLYSRMLAYETQEVDMLESLIEGGKGYRAPEAPGVALDIAIDRFGKGLRCFEHGVGRGHHALAKMWDHPEAYFVMSDYRNAYHEFQVKMLTKYVESYEFIWAWVSENSQYISWVDRPKFHYVNSEEVMEHVPNPKGMIQWISDHMVEGGVLHMSTWFNSHGGEDMSHLKENEIYQDGELWFDEVVAGADIRHIGDDPRGCKKIFEKGNHG